MKQIGFVIFIILFITQCRPREEKFNSIFPGKPEVPASIKAEHEYLLEKIRLITLFKDSTGLASGKLYDLIQHHFKEEEDYVFPQLGLLPKLAGGELPEHSDEIILLSEKLKSQLIHINAEHQLIKAYIEELILSDKNKGHPEIIQLEKDISKHAQFEEEVFFPASILVGEYLKLKSTKRKIN